MRHESRIRTEEQFIRRSRVRSLLGGIVLLGLSFGPALEHDSKGDAITVSAFCIPAGLAVCYGIGRPIGESAFDRQQEVLNALEVEVNQPVIEPPHQEAA